MHLAVIICHHGLKMFETFHTGYRFVISGFACWLAFVISVLSVSKKSSLNFVRLWCFPMFSHAMGKVMLSDFAHAQVMTPSWLVQKFSQNHGRRLQL